MLKNILLKVIKIFFKLFNKNIYFYLPETPELPAASKILEIEYGHQKSSDNQIAIDKDDNPLPWITYPAIDFLKQLDLKDKVLLEWGCGNSSLFFSERVKMIYSIEHNEKWYLKIKNLNIKNHHLILGQENNYANSIENFNTNFDIIFIDGIQRNECAFKSISYLKTSGIILLDNSERHPDICEYFRNNNLIQIDFYGFSPINLYTSVTSIFLHREYNFKPLNIQPIFPIGGDVSGLAV